MKVKMPSFMWTTTIVIILVLEYFAILPSFDAQASVDCDPQSFSSLDCPTSSPESDNDNGGDSGNIEAQIPSVIPFP